MYTRRQACVVAARVAADGPGPGDGYRLAYDSARRVAVLFGGETAT